jgi:transcriptional regulator with XRE-family HTH domain
MLLGGRVLKLRIKRGLNQKQLSEASGITQATISRIESGKVKELRSESLLRLARALGVTMEYLIDTDAKLTPKDIIRSDPEAVRILKLYRTLTLEQRALFSGILDALTVPDRIKRAIYTAQLQLRALVSATEEATAGNEELIKELFPDGLKFEHLSTLMQGFDESIPYEEKKEKDELTRLDNPFEYYKNRYKQQFDKRLKEMKTKKE